MMKGRSGTTLRWGVFWDYGSLFQHERTEAETELFKQGLGFLGSFYSHPETIVFRLTTFPEGYPEGYDLPSWANVAAYPDRGCAAPSPCPSTHGPPPPSPSLSAPPLCAFPRARCTHSSRCVQVVFHRDGLGDHDQELRQVARPRQAAR